MAKFNHPLLLTASLALLFSAYSYSKEGNYPKLESRGHANSVQSAINYLTLEPSYDGVISNATDKELNGKACRLNFVTKKVKKDSSSYDFFYEVSVNNETNPAQMPDGNFSRGGFKVATNDKKINKLTLSYIAPKPHSQLGGTGPFLRGANYVDVYFISKNNDKQMAPYQFTVSYTDPQKVRNDQGGKFICEIPTEKYSLVNARFDSSNSHKCSEEPSYCPPKVDYSKYEKKKKEADSQK